MNRSTNLFQNRLVRGGLPDPVADTLLNDCVQELRRGGSAEYDDGYHWIVSVKMRNDGRSIHPGHFQVAENGRNVCSLVLLLHEGDSRLSAVGQERMISPLFEHQL